MAFTRLRLDKRRDFYFSRGLPRAEIRWEIVPVYVVCVVTSEGVSHSCPEFERCLTSDPDPRRSERVVASKWRPIHGMVM
jgi:hypothetical protein